MKIIINVYITNHLKLFLLQMLGLKLHLNTCNGKIECRPPPTLTHTSDEPIPNIFTFLKSLGE